MLVFRFVNATLLVSLLSACGGTTLPSQTGVSPPAPVGVSPPSPVERTPDYRTNGFSTDEQSATAGVIVFDEDTGGATVGYRSDRPVDLSIRYSPRSRIDVTSVGQTRQGGTDREQVSLPGDSMNRFGDGTYDNLGRFRVNNYAYAGVLNINEDDGRYRHLVVFSDGERAIPTASASYGGAFSVS